MWCVVHRLIVVDRYWSAATNVVHEIEAMDVDDDADHGDGDGAAEPEG